ncbi:arrestin domain-containing protein 17-like [Condylostylus longicornis]|uniref:arrestin domain-containing protein 17-like n=1 Tax=Condylostylus longicornis TaxID=2530218 RepID=UPI00244E34A5|nr:arrestin domain-containing protein 17-like [Condylostylus longicornis]
MTEIEGIIRFKDNPFKSYYAGATIFGEFDLNLDGPINIHGIKVIISGKANVFLCDTGEEDRSKFEQIECIRYIAKQDYFENTTYIYGEPDGNHHLNKGYHSYEFTYNLPMELPSSMEGHFGRIRYYVKVVIEFGIPNKSPEAFTSYFTVHRLTDLNYEPPMIRLPTINEVQKQFSCCPCWNKPVIILARIPQSGYVCGQKIPISINITNRSGKSIHKFIISLHLIIKYRAEFPSCKEKFEEFIVKNEQTKLFTNSIQESLNVDLKVPSVPPTCNEQICRIIRISYELRIQVFIQGCIANMNISMPITIGNIPLRNLKQNSIYILNSTYEAPKTPEIFAKDINIHPPTYEEACYIKSKKLPEYPVYNFNPPTPRLHSLLNHY